MEEERKRRQHIYCIAFSLTYKGFYSQQCAMHTQKLREKERAKKIASVSKKSRFYQVE